MTPEPMLAENRRTPSSKVTSRTSIRTTESRSWLNPLLIAPKTGVPARENATARAKIDRGNESFKVESFSRWQPTEKNTTFKQSKGTGNLSGTRTGPFARRREEIV